MPSSTVNQITTPPDRRFFLAPEFPLQRQYEALRAFFVEEEPSVDVARRFGYSQGAFRVLCHQFRHNPDKRASFFRQPHRGPQTAPTRDRVRALAVACVNAISPFTTCSGNSPPPVTPSALIP